MTIPMGGLAALLVVATFALTSCGGDDGASAPTTSSAAVTATATVTQTATAKAPSSATSTSTTTAQTTSAPTTATTTAKAPATTPASTPSSGAGASGCGPVEIGLREGDVELTYARITAQRGVSCQTVTIVAQQWGAQKIGIDKALLPQDWSCSGTSCSGPKGSFSFTLYKPQE